LQLMDLCQYAERKLTAHSGRKWPYDSRLTITHGSSATLTLPDYGRFARDLRDFAMGGPGSIGARSS